MRGATCRAELETAMLDRYKRITGAGDDFDAAYHVLGAQRNAKIVGIFTRLWKRDGKPRYPALCPRVWALSGARSGASGADAGGRLVRRQHPAELRGDPMAIAGE